MELNEVMELMSEYLEEVEEGESDEGKLNELLTLVGQKEDIIDSYCFLIEQLNLEMVAVKLQLSCLKEKYDKKLGVLKNKYEKLESKLLNYHLDGRLQDKEKGKNYKLHFRNYPVVELTAPIADIPVEYVVVKTSESADLRLIKKALKDEKLTFARLADNYKIEVK